jgi:hypothetical protein
MSAPSIANPSKVISILPETKNSFTSPKDLTGEVDAVYLTKDDIQFLFSKKLISLACYIYLAIRHDAPDLNSNEWEKFDTVTIANDWSNENLKIDLEPNDVMNALTIIFRKEILHGAVPYSVQLKLF